MVEFFTLTMIAFLMIVSPGPDFAIVTKTAVVSGRAAGFGAAFGIAMANFCLVCINLLGIGVLIAQSVLAFTVLKILGAIYLIYIGVKGLRAKPVAKSAQTEISAKEIESEMAYIQSGVFQQSNTHAKNPVLTSQTLAKKGFYSGFITSILNPKACLFFLSFFSVLISPGTALATQALYGIWICVLAMFWFSMVTLFFTNPIISEKLKNGKHWIERITGGLLILLGLHLLAAEASI
jgi:threonine/homoserine/homoserine lactone efflux protein